MRSLSSSPRRTGTISLAIGGVFWRGLDRRQLKLRLQEQMASGRTKVSIDSVAEEV